MAGNSARAMEIARDLGLPEVILLDIGLPGTNGFELAQQLRADPKFADTTLVAVTGYGSDLDREKSMAAGFDYHQVKPVQIDEILAVLTGRSN